MTPAVKIVPVELDDNMHLAADNASDLSLHEIYEAAIAAAPDYLPLTDEEVSTLWLGYARDLALANSSQLAAHRAFTAAIRAYEARLGINPK